MTIPKIIHQTWKSKELTPYFKKASNSWKRMNPNYTYQFYDDMDCLEFIIKMIERFYWEDMLMFKVFCLDRIEK